MGKIKIEFTTFAEIDREWKERLNFTYEELMNSDDEISNFSELNEKVDEVLFQNWKKSEDKKNESSQNNKNKIR